MLKAAALFAILMLLLAAPLGCGCDEDDDDSGGSNDWDDDDDESPDDDDDTSPDDDDDDDDDNDDDNDDDDETCDWVAHDPLITTGKTHLYASEIYEAYEAFADARDLCPESVDADFGMSLAIMLELERALYEVIFYMNTPIFDGDDKGFGSILQSFLMYHFLPKADELMTHLEAVQQKAAPGWSFYTENYPLIVNGELTDEVWVDMPGEWDLADTYMMQSFGEAMRTLVHAICAFDLTIDYAWIRNLPAFGGDLVESIHALAEWMLVVLEDEDVPEFLTLFPESGAQELSLAGQALGSMFMKANQGSLLMLEETDNQDNDVAGYVDQNANGQFDEGEPWHLPYIGVLSDNQSFVWDDFLSLFVSMGQTCWDGGPLDVHPNFPDVMWLSEINFFLEAAGVPFTLPPVPINLGPYFYDPDDTGLKDALVAAAEYLYAATVPDRAFRRFF